MKDVFSRRAVGLAATVFALSACSTSGVVVQAGEAADTNSVDATRLPTGVHLDPAGVVRPVGQMPLAIALSPSGSRAALLLNGWGQTGVQVVDWRLGRVVQTLKLPAAFIGLAFSPDGQSLMASGGNTDLVYRYRWAGDSAVLADSIKLAPTAGEPRHSGKRYPAQLAFSPDGKRLYVAENLADSLAVIDIASGAVIQRVPSGRYPYGVVVAPDGRVFASAWGGNEVTAFTPSVAGLTSAQRIPAGRHPSAMLLNRDGSRLFVASATTDQIAVLDSKTGKLLGELRDPPPGGPDEGTTPNALALSADETRLYVAEADANAVAVFDLKTDGSGTLAGRVPTDWYPASLAVSGSSLIVGNGKGRGTAPNPNGPGPRNAEVHAFVGNNEQYTLGQLRGSLSVLDASTFDAATLAQYSRRVAAANGWTGGAHPNRFPPIEHVIYVIRENRTYDQVLGDLARADGDTSLLYFGRSVTPNAHALAERFGIFDRFFVNAEVSGDGHNWSTAAYASDYVEKTVQPNYSGRGRVYDYEGTNRGVVPDDDVNEGRSGYLWTLAAKKGITLRNYGEFVVADKEAGAGKVKGDKPELLRTTNTDYPNGIGVSEQKRADVWLAELATYVERGSMPALEIVRMPNDHTLGAAAGKPTPRAMVADNDLALGRMMAALTRTPFWKSTVVFVLEDDAQNGPDHVDSHRSPLLVLSPYSRSGVYHRFTNTTDVIRTIEGMLGLGSLSHFDYYGRPLNDIWASEPDLRPWDVITPQQSLTELNPGSGRGAKESEQLKLDDVDESDDDFFSELLWHTIKGYDKPYPGPTRMGSLEARRSR